MSHEEVGDIQTSYSCQGIFLHEKICQHRVSHTHTRTERVRGVKERDAYATNLSLNYFWCNHLCRCTHLTRGSTVVGLVYVPQGSIHEYNFEYSGMQVTT